jgi:transposase InsO family protein
LIIQLREKLASQGLDHGPHTIAWHLQHHHGLQVSVNSIHRHLHAAGPITPAPQKRPKSSYIRFAADQPNERWQADFTHWRLADGTHVEILDWLDDHARYAVSVTAHRRVTGPIVLAEFRKAVDIHGVPASTLTDNGMVFTTRLSGGKGGRHAFENELHRLGVTQSTPPPTTPPAARSNASTKPSKNGSPTNPAPPRSPSCKPSWMPPSRPTTTTAHTARWPTKPPQPPPTPPDPKPTQQPAPTPTTACAPTASTKPASSPCVSPGAYTTSASAEPTPEPAS